MQPTTIRLTEQDQTFLASLKIAGASTISDKLRALIEDRRLQQQAARDYRSALVLANSIVGPLNESIKMAENQHRMHSQLIERMGAWTPELLAILLTEGSSSADEPLDPARLKALEDLVANHLLRLLDVILQTCIARDTALYAAASLGPQKLQPLRRLCRFVMDETQKDDNP
ncbi:MAG: hypothetical protein RLZZ385_2825 [Pseudomonadota bacterium]